MNQDSSFEVEKLSIAFGGLMAVTNFSLTMPSSSLYGLIGPNGAGKTTVFNLVTGVYRPDSGSMKLRGRSLIGLKPNEIAKAGITRTFQNIRLFRDLTILENVLVTLHMSCPYGYSDILWSTRLFRETESQWKEKAMGLLSLLGLAKRAQERAKNLPYGDQRRLEIARALASDPKVLFLDEPAAGLNSGEKVELMKTVARIREKFKVSILLIEHDMKLVMGICEKITVLDHGETIAFGTPKEIQAHPKVIEAYLGVG